MVGFSRIGSNNVLTTGTKGLPAFGSNATPSFGNSVEYHDEFVRSDSNDTVKKVGLIALVGLAVGGAVALLLRNPKAAENVEKNVMEIELKEQGILSKIAGIFKKTPEEIAEKARIKTAKAEAKAAQKASKVESKAKIAEAQIEAKARKAEASAAKPKERGFWGHLKDRLPLIGRKKTPTNTRLEGLGTEIKLGDATPSTPPAAPAPATPVAPAAASTPPATPPVDAEALADIGAGI